MQRFGTAIWNVPDMKIKQTSISLFLCCAQVLHSLHQPPVLPVARPSTSLPIQFFTSLTLCPQLSCDPHKPPQSYGCRTSSVWSVCLVGRRFRVLELELSWCPSPRDGGCKLGSNYMIHDGSIFSFLLLCNQQLNRTIHAGFW